jgi:chorismate mutase
MPNSTDTQATLAEQRQALEVLDRALVTLLEQRHKIVLELAELKRTQGLPLKDSSQEARVLERVRAQCSAVSQSYVETVYCAMFAAARGDL